MRLAGSLIAAHRLLLLWHMCSLVVVCELLVAACMWDLVP